MSFPRSPPPPPLHLLIIGAGLSGLAASISTSLSGHAVTILEASPRLHEIGAGLQLTPNGTRLLFKWGVADDLAPKAAASATLCIRRFDGRILARRQDYQGGYGSPLWCLHRVDLQRALARRAEALGVRLRLGCKVVDVGFDDATVVLESGEVVKGDLVLAADGLWSAARSLFLGKPTMPEPTGDLAYRILLQAEDIEDPELRQWVTKPGMNVWIGPAMHIVAYSICGGSMYNMVLLVPDDLPEDTAKGQGDIGEMRKLFENWDPILNRFLSNVKEVSKWRLHHVPPLDSWTSPSGKFTMAGDACHAMLPYLSQGANSALEDGAVLGALLGKAKVPSDIPAAVTMYEKLRKERVERIVACTFLHREEFHMRDGPEQRERDAWLAREEEVVDEKELWTHPKIQPWLFGYNAYAEVEKIGLS